MYGITETTVHVTYRALTASDAERPGPSPIGVPLPDLRIYILDGQRQPVPVGVTGELLIGGAGVARGYSGRSGLTAERFVPDPFSGVPGARLYRTGDRVRWSPDGRLEFVGRLDDQLKVRGFRVEPGEVETCLRRCPGVADAVVELRDERLVAYVLPAPGAAVRTADLRGALGRSLPDYMIPTTFVPLTELPLTASGKVDRRALPAPEPPRAYEPPRTPVEELLAGVWQELLGLERVGAGDSFFELGGHSLTATQLLARLRSALGLELPLQLVFEQPVLADLAATVSVRLLGAEDGADELLTALGREARR
jgi:acyl carrier protein